MTSQEPEVTSNHPEGGEDVPIVSPRLKFFVIAQGIVIIALVILMIGTVAYRVAKKAQKGEQEVTPAQITAVPATVMAKAGSVKAPEGSKLHRVHAGDVTVTLEFLHESGQTTLVIIDMASGLERGRCLSTPQASA